MYVWVHDKYSPTSFKQRLWREKLFWYDEINLINNAAYIVCYGAGVSRDKLQPVILLWN